ncbi:MAG: hypothetical protein ACK4F7_01490 [Inhella sp.]
MAAHAFHHARHLLRALSLAYLRLAGWKVEGSLRVKRCIPPEGKRDKVTVWENGFYWIAHQAGVATQLAYMV